MPGAFDRLILRARDQMSELTRQVEALLFLSPEPLSVVSCALRPAPRDPADAAEERRLSILFDRMEKACPGVFRGQSAVTEPLGGGWSRNYNGLDARLEALGGRVVLNHYGSGRLTDLGALADWESPRGGACGDNAEGR